MLHGPVYDGALAPKEIPSHETVGSLTTEVQEWLTTEEAAQYLRVSEATLRNMASNGRIPYYKLGRSNRYLRSELKRLLLTHSKGTSHGNHVR